MRKVFAALALAALPLAGCKHVGGECDCAPMPGDSVGHNPHVAYHAMCPIRQAVATQATHPTSSPTPEEFEPIGPPKALPGR